jgi:hypothetical protein
MHVMTEVLFLTVGIASAASVAFAWAWWRRGKVLAEFNARCTHLEMSLAAARRSLVQLSTQARDKEVAVAALKDVLARNARQIEQLRDLVKMYVARRREYDEWANPIRASLGEAFGRVIQELKDHVARQEFAMRRQERIVIEAQDRYRDKRDELERLQRELTLKNYHIAALNERFIRIEERIEDLSTEIGGESSLPVTNAPPTLASGELMPQQDVSRFKLPESPATERFTLATDSNKDWMGALDDWHRQLQGRFERLEELQARLRGSAGGATAEAPQPRRREDPAA